ncbi:MAG TPA: hypothetical protein VLW85_23905 [Myxococcales bacterium]|nr:hypothetical protein [Myxococcales bacterium]
MAKKTPRKLLDAARRHQDALQAAGLSGSVIDKYENALKGVDAGSRISPAATVLVKDLHKEVDEFQAAMRKEFPGNASFQAVFKANEPIPEDARDVLAVGRIIAKEAPDYAQNLIKYAINAASVKHLTYLCDQLEKEIGGADPAQDAKSLEEQILAAAKSAFEGKPELSQFEAK